MDKNIPNYYHDENAICSWIKILHTAIWASLLILESCNSMLWTHVGLNVVQIKKYLHIKVLIRKEFK